jgi:hypothetical protein
MKAAAKIRALWTPWPSPGIATIHPATADASWRLAHSESPKVFTVDL